MSCVLHSDCQHSCPHTHLLFGDNLCIGLFALNIFCSSPKSQVACRSFSKHNSDYLTSLLKVLQMSFASFCIEFKLLRVEAGHSSVLYLSPFYFYGMIFLIFPHILLFSYFILVVSQ